jgi:hypothetical protein
MGCLSVGENHMLSRSRETAQAERMLAENGAERSSGVHSDMYNAKKHQHMEVTERGGL